MIKKYFLITLVALAPGCSDKNEAVDKIDSDTPSSCILPIKVTDTDDDGEPMSIKYNGNKIISIISDINPDNKILFTYDGDNIVSIRSYINNKLNYERDYNYSNDKLIYSSHVSILDRDQITYSYTYVNTTTIKAIKTMSYSQNETTYNLDYKLNSDGVVTSFSGQGSGVSNGTSETYELSVEITYGDKNAPFKNVTGFNKLILDNDISLLSNVKNNILMYKEVRKTKSATVSSEDWYYCKTTSTYNKENYPTKEIMRYYNTDDTPSLSDPEIYLYEYNK